MRETTIHNDVEVEHVVDAQQIRWQHGADAPAAPGRAVVVDVEAQLPRVVGVGPAGAFPDDRGARVARADQHHRGAPVAAPDAVAGEGVAEHRDELAVGCDDRRTEIGGGHAPPVGDSRAGQIGELAVGHGVGGQRGLNKPAVAAQPGQRRREPAQRGHGGAAFSGAGVAERHSMGPVAERHSWGQRHLDAVRRPRRHPGIGRRARRTVPSNR